MFKKMLISFKIAESNCTYLVLNSFLLLSYASTLTYALIVVLLFKYLVFSLKNVSNLIFYKNRSSDAQIR